MRQGLPSLYALQIFEVVARRRSFTRAAEELCITQGAVSHQIRSLEEDLGFSLFVRAGRTIKLTPAGEKILPVLQASLTDIREQLWILRRESESEKQVSVSTTPYFAARWLLHRLSLFSAEFPEINVRVVQNLGYRAHMRSCDVNIIWGHERDMRHSEHILLKQSPLRPVCQPAVAPLFKQALQKGLTKPEFEFLHFDDQRRAWPLWWRCAGGARRMAFLGPQIADSNIRMQRAVDGRYIALADELIQPELDAGTLLQASTVQLPGYGYYFALQKKRHNNDSVRLFLDWLSSMTERASTASNIQPNVEHQLS